MKQATFIQKKSVKISRLPESAVIASLFRKYIKQIIIWNILLLLYSKILGVENGESYIWQSLEKTLIEMCFAFPNIFSFFSFKLQVMLACEYFFTWELAETNTCTYTCLFSFSYPHFTNKCYSPQYQLDKHHGTLASACHSSGRQTDRLRSVFQTSSQCFCAVGHRDCL